MKPFFSVVIPTYNRAHCIQQTIDSVLRQDFEDWELMIVDDGSTDNTGTIVLGNKDARIHYLRKENGERGAARNFGADHASGEYIFFLDSDDLIKPGYLKVAYDLISKTNAKCVHIPYDYLQGNTEIQGPRGREYTPEKLRVQNRFACQIIVHRDCMKEFRFSENRNFTIGEDWCFILQLMSKYRFEIATERLGLIVRHEQRTMAEAPYTKVLDSLALFLQEIKIKIPGDVSLALNVEHELTNLAALHAAMQREKKKAFSLLMRSLSIRPGRLFRYRNFVILKKIIFN